MQTHSFRNYFPNEPSLYIVAVWSIGLCLGIWIGQEVSYPLSGYLSLACSRPASPVVVASVLPLILIWLSVWRTSPGLIFPVLFMKAFLDGILLIAVSRAFGTASWLLAPMLLFSDRISTFILLFASAKYLTGDLVSHHRWFFLCFVVLICVLLIDYLCVSPCLITFVS